MSDAFGREIRISRGGRRLGQNAFLRTFPGADTAALAPAAGLYSYSDSKEFACDAYRVTAEIMKAGSFIG